MARYYCKILSLPGLSMILPFEHPSRARSESVSSERRSCLTLTILHVRLLSI
jgi:hypothetical protein